MTLKTTAILLLALSSLFWMASCGNGQTQVMVQAPPQEQAMPPAPSAEPSLEEMLQKLEQQTQKPAPEPEPSPELPEELPVEEQAAPLPSGPLPTTKKEACKLTGLPATYEACLNGCARTCGDIAMAKCDEVEVPGQDQNFVCYSCSCA